MTTLYLPDVNGDEIQKNDLVKFWDGRRIYTVIDLMRNGKVVITAGSKLYTVESTILRWVKSR